MKIFQPNRSVNNFAKLKNSIALISIVSTKSPHFTDKNIYLIIKKHNWLDAVITLINESTITPINYFNDSSRISSW